MTQRKPPPPPSALYVERAIAAGLAKVPFDFGMSELGSRKTNEPAVHGPVTGLHLTRCEVANGGRRDMEDPTDVATTEVNARKHGQKRWRNLSGWPALASRATRFAVHVEVAALTHSCLLP